MPELPRFHLATVERLRDRLITRVFSPLQGETIQGDNLEDLALAVGHALTGVPHDTVYESLRLLAGQVLTPERIGTTAWRLAGNLTTMQAGRPALGWQSQLVDEWVPVQILRVWPARNRAQKPGYDVSLRALLGPLCPTALHTFWPSSATKLIARQVGFSAPWGKYPFRRGNELVGLRLAVLIEAAKSRQAPYFFETRCSSAMQTWNRTNVLRLRCRHGEQCPQDFRHACRVCAVGYVECAGSTHRLTYTQGFCDGCGAHSFFDPERPAVHCVTCDDKERRARRE